MKELTLCDSCAFKLAAVYTLRKVAGDVVRKIHCDQCGQNRFGGTYQVTVNKERR